MTPIEYDGLEDADEFRPAIYEGIDFANRDRHIGRCRILDRGGILSWHEFDEQEQPVRSAVDCPLGTSLGFEQLLSGQIPEDTFQDGYKTRATEQWFRQHVSDYQTNALWLNRNAAEREQFPRPSYFNGGAHVQSTLALQIVPACLAWLLEMLGPFNNAADRQQAFVDARRGEGPTSG